MDITFLCPADPVTNAITKTYTKEAGLIRQTSDYNAGYLFDYAVESIDDKLPAQEQLSKFKDLLT